MTGVLNYSILETAIKLAAYVPNGMFELRGMNLKQVQNQVTNVEMLLE